MPGCCGAHRGSREGLLGRGEPARDEHPAPAPRLTAALDLSLGLNFISGQGLILVSPAGCPLRLPDDRQTRLIDKSTLGFYI